MNFPLKCTAVLIAWLRPSNPPPPPPIPPHWESYKRAVLVSKDTVDDISLLPLDESVPQLFNVVFIRVLGAWDTSPVAKYISINVRFPPLNIYQKLCIYGRLKIDMPDMAPTLPFHSVTCQARPKSCSLSLLSSIPISLWTLSTLHMSLRIRQSSAVDPNHDKREAKENMRRDTGQVVICTLAVMYTLKHTLVHIPQHSPPSRSTHTAQYWWFECFLGGKHLNLVAWCYFLFILIFYSTYIFSITFILYSTFTHRHSPKFLCISSSLVTSVGKTSLGCRAENQTRAFLTGSRRTTNWATQHPLSYAAPTELRRTQTSHLNIPPPSRRTHRALYWGFGCLPQTQTFVLFSILNILFAGSHADTPELETYEVDLESYTCVKNELKLFSCVKKFVWSCRQDLAKCPSSCVRLMEGNAKCRKIDL